MRSRLPVTCGSCPSCGSADEVRTLSTSPATGEVLLSCECGEQWWEDDLSHPRHMRSEKEAA
jgi:uncharacterized Zn finger protein